MAELTTRLGKIHAHFGRRELEGTFIVWGGPAGSRYARLTTSAGAVDCRGVATWDGGKWSGLRTRVNESVDATPSQVREIEAAVLDALQSGAGRNSAPMRAQAARERRARLAEIDAQLDAVEARRASLRAEAQALEAEL